MQHCNNQNVSLENIFKDSEQLQIENSSLMKSSVAALSFEAQ